MKSAFYVILFVGSVMLLTSCNSAKKEKTSDTLVTITGQITNPASDSVWFRLDTPIGRKMKQNGTAVDSNGHFDRSFHVDRPYPVTFFDGNESTQMFVKPGDQIHLTIDTKAFDETIKYTGVGSEESNYLAKKYLEFDDKGSFFIYEKRDSLGINGGIRYLDSLKKVRFQFLDEYQSESNLLSPEFIRWEKTNIEFETPTRLIEFTYNRSIDSTFDKAYQIFGSYKEVNPLDTLSLQYGYYLDNYYNYLVNQNRDLWQKSKNAESVILNLIITHSDGYARNNLLANLFEFKIQNYQIEFLDQYRDIFDQYVTMGLFKESVLATYQQISKVLEAKMPANAHLINLENEKYNYLTYQNIINRYKGKVIYLDFWASWCGPCKAEMPFSLGLQKKFNDKEVAFVYFSSDADSVAWKNMVRILQISGDHYRLSKSVRKVTNDLFDVQFIPRYVLIDKMGNVVEAAAKRPSNNEIVGEIEKLL